MQRIWSSDELGECWSLLPEDLALLAGRVDAGKLGFAVQLAFWRRHGRFPDDEADVAPAVITHLAAQIGVSVAALDGYAWVGRSGRRHRVAIIDHLSVAAFDEAAEGRFRRWLADNVLPREFAPSVLDEELSGWFARNRLTRPRGLCCRVLGLAGKRHNRRRRDGLRDDGGAGSGVQGSAVRGRGDPLGGTLVSDVPDQLPRSRAHAAGTAARLGV